MGLLDGSKGRAALSRARWILGLAELQALARSLGRPWVTHGEWATVMSRPTPAATKKDRIRLRDALAVDGVELELREEAIAHGQQIVKLQVLVVGTKGLLELVELELREASAIAESFRARREGSSSPAQDDELDFSREKAVANLQEIETDYQVQKKSFRFLRKKWRFGTERLRSLLVRRGVDIRASRKPAIEVLRTDRELSAARRVRAEGGSYADVARVLRCSIVTAWRWLRRSSRETRGLT